jgi:hypothetical protein
MAFRQPPQPPFYKKGLLDGSFSIVSTNTPTANATQQGLICDSGQRATAVPIAHQRVAEDCLADTLDREAFVGLGRAAVSARKRARGLTEALVLDQSCAQLSDGVAACAIQNRLRLPGELGCSEAGLNGSEIVDPDGARALVGPIRGPEMSGVVKGFGCRPVRDGSDAAVGRRSKVSKGGNRGTRGRRRRCRDLWGLSRPLARVVRV